MGMSVEEANAELATLLNSNAPNINTVIHCIQSGADINLKNADSQTILHRICIICPENVGQILDLNPDIHAEDNRKKTPLATLLTHRPKAINSALELINRGANVRARSSINGNYLLHIAARYYPERIPELLKSGLDVTANFTNYKLKTPLSKLLKYHPDQIDAAIALIEKGADANTKDLRGRTLLELAVEKNQLKYIPRLLDLGVDASGFNFNTLMKDVLAALTVTNPPPELIEVAIRCIQREADVNSVNQIKQTILHLAVRASLGQKNADVLLTTLPRLLQYGANPNLTDTLKWSAFDTVNKLVYDERKRNIANQFLVLADKIFDLELYGYACNDDKQKQTVKELVKALRDQLPLIQQTNLIYQFNSLLSQAENTNNIFNKDPVWKTLLINIALAAAGLLVFYAAACCVNLYRTNGKHFFLFTQSAGLKKKESVEEAAQALHGLLRKAG